MCMTEVMFLPPFINLIVKRSYHADEELNVTVDSNSSLPLAYDSYDFPFTMCFYLQTKVV